MSRTSRLTICPACVRHIRHSLHDDELTCPFCETRFALDDLEGTTPTAAAVPRGLKQGVMAASFVGATIFGAVACQGPSATDDEITSVTEADEASAVEPEGEDDETVATEPPEEIEDEESVSNGDDDADSSAAFMDSPDDVSEDYDKNDKNDENDKDDGSDSATDRTSGDDETPTEPPSPDDNHAPIQPEYGVTF